jgi:hypothetical protein
LPDPEFVFQRYVVVEQAAVSADLALANNLQHQKAAKRAVALAAKALADKKAVAIRARD